MLSLNDKISVRQLQALLIMDILGTGVIILPRRAAEYANQDGWLVIVVMTAIGMAYIYLITSVGRLFPEKTFLEYCTIIVGKPLAVIISVGFIAKILVTTAMELRFFAEIVHQTMLHKTPFLAIFIALLSVSAFAAAKGIETRARIAEVLIPVIFVPLGIVYLIAATDIDFTNLLPLFKTPPADIAAGGFAAGVSFTGIEFCLLVYPYLQRPKQARKGAVAAVFLIGACMLAITLITIAKFGPHDVKRQMWPVVELMDVVDFPGAFIERQEALMISFWIVSVFSIVNAGLFFASIQLKSIYKKVRHSVYILVCVPIIILIAYMPADIQNVIKIMEFMFITFGVSYMLIIPLLLLTIAKLRGLGDSFENK